MLTLEEQPGQRFVILPPPVARYLPDKFAVWAKAVVERLQAGGLERLPIRVLVDYQSGEMKLGYHGDRETCRRVQRIFEDVTHV